MNPTVLLLVLGALGYFLLTKDDDKDGGQSQDGQGRRHRSPRHGGTYAAQQQPPSPYGPTTVAPPSPPPPPQLPPPVAAPPASSSLLSAAQALLAVLPSPDCNAISQATTRFQQQAMAERRNVGPTGADGQYGPSTQRVLAEVLRHAAPPSLWGPGGRCRGTTPGAPSWPGQVTPSADSGPGSARPLLDQLNAMIADADGKSDPNDAVLGYKAAGMFAVSTLGPAIDVQTGGQSKPLTGAAWQANGPLQAIRSPRTFSLDRGAKATVADKMRARSILTLQMRDKYLAALDRFAAAGYATGYYATGIGTVIPSQYRAAPACFDAQTDVHLCAAVASALATETDPNRLQSFGQAMAAQGFPQAGAALMGKAASLRVG